MNNSGSTSTSRWPWDILDKYCTTPDYRAWILEQLEISPIPQGQSAEDWLLARSRVAEGYSEPDAWAYAWSQNHHSDIAGTGGEDVTMNGGSTPFDYNPPPSVLGASSNAYGGSSASTTYSNSNTYKDHYGYASSSSQPQSQGVSVPAPYGFVSLRDVAPLPSTSNSPQVNIDASHLFQGFQAEDFLVDELDDDVKPNLFDLESLRQAETLRSSPHSQSAPSQIAGPSWTSSSAPGYTSAGPKPHIPKLTTSFDLDIIPLPSNPFEPISLNNVPSSSNKALAPFTPRPSSPFFIQRPSPSEIVPRPSTVLNKRSASPTKLLGSVMSAPTKSKKTKYSSSSIDPPPTLNKPISNGNVNSIGKGKAPAVVKVKNETAGPPRPSPATASGGASASVNSGSANAPVTMNTIRSLLASEKLKDDKPKPVALWKLLRSREGKENTRLPPLFTPTPSELREIALLLRDRAPAAYLRKMADDDRYTLVWAKWLRGFVKEPEVWKAAIPPVLQVLARTDMPIDYIADFKLMRTAKRIAELASEKNLANKAEIQAAHDKYQNFVAKVLLPAKRKSEQADEDGPEPKDAAKPAQPLASTSSTSNPAGVSSASSVKARLPDIKKVDKSLPAASSSSSTANVSRPIPAIPSGFSSGLLAQTMQSLKTRVGGSMEGVSYNEMKREKDDENKPRRVLKSGRVVGNIRFRDLVEESNGGGPLEDVRIFKEEPWEMEMPFWKIGEDDHVHGSSLHDLEQEEGAALAAFKNHAVIDWYEPSVYNEGIPTTTTSTPEVLHQTERERGILSIAYPPNLPIPDPDESSVKIVETDSSTQYKVLKEEEETQVHAQAQPQMGLGYSGAGAPTIPAISTNVSELLKGLGNLPGLIPSHTGYNYTPPANPYVGYNHTQPPLNPYAPVQVQTNPNPHPNPNPWDRPQQAQGYDPYSQQRTSGSGAWSAQDNYGHSRSSYDDRSRGGGGGGNGRWQSTPGSGSQSAERGGRGFKPRTCKYWKAGTCKQGRDCPFLHD